jgi:adenine-specific DNA-methyltransferase
VRYEPRRHAARSTNEFVFHQLLPYLGNKRHLLDLILRALKATGCAPATATFVDAFAGSGVVARFAKHLGFAVIANDWEPYARVVNAAALLHHEAPAMTHLGGYHNALATLNALPGIDGWVTRTLCPEHDDHADPLRERMFYRRVTGQRIDAIREQIRIWQDGGACSAHDADCLLAPLLYQACWLANTSGVFKGFHAGWGGKNGTALHRILADLQLLPLQFCASERDHQVHNVNTFELPKVLKSRPDVVYLDPPYNQHPYASNYHVLNSLVQWDQPDLPPATRRGFKAAIRPDWRERRSTFNARGGSADAMSRLLTSIDAHHVLISYSTDGLIPLERLLADAGQLGALKVYCRSYKRYRTSPTRPSLRPHNVEFVLHVDCERAAKSQYISKALAQIQAVRSATSLEGLSKGLSEQGHF